MKALTRKEIEALPKASGSLFAKTTRWDPNDPRSTIDTQNVRIRDMGQTWDVIATVEDVDPFTSIIFEIPKTTESGEHNLGYESPDGIRVGYNVIFEDGEVEWEEYRATKGKITLVVESPGTHFKASEFRFTGRIGSAGKTVDITLGKFDISL